MNSPDFQNLVRQALLCVPDDIKSNLDNVDILIEDWPSKQQLFGSAIEDDQYLLGLYEGIPRTERFGYDMVLPDKITLFKKSIEAISSNESEIIENVKTTILHELAHHFGIDDPTLEKMGL
jgi:predicted Zn-dependent protease with MMP-like domain